MADTAWEAEAHTPQTSSLARCSPEVCHITPLPALPMGRSSPASMHEATAGCHSALSVKRSRLWPPLSRRLADTEWEPGHWQSPPRCVLWEGRMSNTLRQEDGRCPWDSLLPATN